MPPPGPQSKAWQAPTFQISKPPKLLQDRKQLGEALGVAQGGPVLGQQLHPQGASISQEVQLIEEGRLVPRGQVAVGSRKRLLSRGLGSRQASPERQAQPVQRSKGPQREGWGPWWACRPSLVAQGESAVTLSRSKAGPSWLLGWLVRQPPTFPEPGQAGGWSKGSCVLQL